MTGTNDKPSPDEAGRASRELFHLNYSQDHGQEYICQRHQEWAERFAAPFYPANVSFANPRRSDRRLRIGYVSGDFRRHPILFFIEPVLRGHDPEKMETFCYSNSTEEDDASAHLQELCRNWRDITAMSDEAACAAIRDDAIDILVDLSGHTAGNRLLTFARRAAPVQVTAYGYVTTTGLKNMDYRLTDPWCDPEGRNQEHYSERLWRLPFGFNCYAPPTDLPEPVPAPSRQSGYVTFASFNNLNKVPPVMFDVWAKILSLVPGSRIVIKDEALGKEDVRQRILERFTAGNVTTDRVELLPRARTLGEHFEIFSKVDIALDSFPYNGTTTTCETLWMGVPVLAIIGTHHQARVSYSILSRIGLEILAANSVEKLIALAVGLAKNQDALVKISDGLRGRLANSRLLDVKGYVEGLEQAYGAMWEAWCAGTYPKGVKT